MSRSLTGMTFRFGWPLMPAMPEIRDGADADTLHDRRDHAFQARGLEDRLDVHVRFFQRAIEGTAGALNDALILEVLDADGAPPCQRMIDVDDDVDAIALVERRREARIVRLVADDAGVEIEIEQAVEDIGGGDQPDREPQIGILLEEPRADFHGIERPDRADPERAGFARLHGTQQFDRFPFMAEQACGDRQAIPCRSPSVRPAARGDETTPRRSAASSAETCVETVGWPMFSSLAAAVKPPDRATAWKAESQR